MKRWIALLLVTPSLALVPQAPVSSSPTFLDVTEIAGLEGPLFNSYVHAGAWGDVDGNGWPDLFVGTFVSGETALPSQLLLNDGGVFADADQEPVEVSGRAAAAVFADLDGDGDDDLFVSNNEKTRGRGSAVFEPSRLYRNDGGTLVDVTEGSGVEAQSSNGRQVGLLDYDGDGLLDLFVVADAFAGGGPTVLLHNDGEMQFGDATAAAGPPTSVRGLGLAIGDVSGDGRPDIFVAGGPNLATPNTNYLFLSNGDGTYREAADHGLDWSPFAVGNEDWVSSGAFGDVDRDGRLDLLIGHHFGSAANAGSGVPIRLYMNRGLDDAGDPVFEDVSDAVGLPAIDAKAPHVDIQDFDNDGWPDLYTSATVGGQPIIFVNTGVVDGNPTFSIPSVADPHYYPAGPVADFDLNGTLDVFLGEFRSVYQGTPDDQGVVPSVLLANQTAGGNWLDVRVAGAGGGIGSAVAIYAAGAAGEPDALLGYREIAVGYGFSSAGLPVAHFGLGQETAVDVVVTEPHGGEVVTMTGVAANQRIVVDGNEPPPPTTTTTTTPPTTTTTPPTSEPVAWWPLDEAGGNLAFDAGGHGYDGVLVGNVERVAGVVGGAAGLDGDGGRIEVPAAALDGADVVTMTMWIATTSIRPQWLVGGAGPDDADAFDVRVRRGTRVELTPGNGGSPLTWTVPDYGDGMWHHVALIRDASSDTAILYFDGALQGSTSASLEPLDLSTVGIGADQTAADVFSTRRSWAGSIDEVRIYHRALYAAEIIGLANG